MLLFRFCVVSLALYALAAMAFAAAEPSVGKADLRKRSGKVTMISEARTPEILVGHFVDRSAISKTERARSLLSRLHSLYKISQPGEELDFQSERVDWMGYTHVRFQQTYRDLLVWGCQVIVHFVNDSTVYCVSGQSIPTPAIATAPNVPESMAELHAIREIQELYPDDSLKTRAKLLIYPNGGDPRLAWRVSVSSTTSPIVSQEVFVDAHADTLLFTFDNICNADDPSTGSGETVLGDTVNFPIYWIESDSTYRLIDATRPMFDSTIEYAIDSLIGVIATYSCTTCVWGHWCVDTCWVSTQADTIWDDTSKFDREAVSTHHLAGTVIDYFWDRHRRNSFDNDSSTFIIRTHSAGSHKAYWQPDSLYIGLRQASDGYRPWSAGLDVLAHEFAHGVTQFNGHGGLIRRGQSGSLQEHFADFFGCMVDSADTTWRIAEDIVLNEPYCLRSMKDPSLTGYPAHMRDFEAAGTIYTNAGIPSYSAYLASTDSDIGRDKADSIWYRALIYHMTDNPGFYWWAQKIELSALELVDAAGWDSVKVMDALREAIDSVGLANTADCCWDTVGNVDYDSAHVVDIGDLTRLIDYLYLSTNPVICPSEANVDRSADGIIDIGDLTRLIAYLYIPPYTPLPSCPQ